MPYSPVLIDTTSTDTKGSFAMAPNGYGRAQTNIPIVVGANLYYVLYRADDTFAGTDNKIEVYKSTDRGATWNQLDGAHAPNRGCAQADGGAYFDGAQTITVAWTDGCVTVDGTLHLQDFSLATETWGAPYGTAGSPTTIRIVDQIYKRSDGTLLALVNTTFASGRIEGVSGVVWNGSTWGSKFPIDSNLSAAHVTDGRAATVLDPVTQTLHVWMRYTDTATFLTHAWLYQQVLLNDTLGAFHQFSTTDMDATVNGNGNPILVGNQIVFGVMNFAQTKATIVVGTPLSAPVFTVMPNPGIDPAGPVASLNGFVPVLAQSSTTIYALTATNDNSVSPDDLQLRLSQTNNLANPAAGPWTTTVIYDISSGPPSFNFPGQLWNNVCIGVYADSQIFVSGGAAIDVTASQDSWFWFGIFTPIFPVPHGSSPLAGGATGTFRVPWTGETAARFRPCQRVNDFAAAQQQEQLRVRREKVQKWPYRSLFPADVDIPVNELADIAAPLPNVVTPILIYTVPSGFTFWMQGILEDFEGAKFLPADFSFTVDINSEVPNTSQASKVQGLIAIPVPLGNFAAGQVWEFPQPYNFEPLTVIRSTVTNVNIPLGGGTFIASFIGYLVPVLGGKR